LQLIFIAIKIKLNLLCQIASRMLKVNPNKIHIVETATDKVPNTSATAASCGSDLNGMAVMVYNILQINLLYANKILHAD